MRPTPLFPVTSGAVYSPCQLYRYRLWRQWDESLPTITFIMLNPSTATEFVNDPTVERCQRRAIKMGFGRIEVANLFAYRSTDPKALRTVPDPIGPDNDQAILGSVQGAQKVIVAWGCDGSLHNRAADVLHLLAVEKITLHSLDVNPDGTPKHPLYVSYAMTPAKFPRQKGGQNGA